ncbi:MAG: ribosome recycling factor [Bacteroidia bacterium]|nr:ribosome recycling factor [Bacteroidia bacterium]
MDENIKPIIQTAKDHMEKTLHHFEGDLAKIRAGKAHPAILEGIKVEYYGSPMPLNQVGNVSVMDARTLQIQPFEKKMIGPIERAIIEANIGLNPQNNGDIIRVPIPALNEQRRKELVKQAKTESENAKIAIRNIRHETNNKVKKLTGVSEDSIKDAEKKVQVMTDDHISRIDKMLKLKEEEITHI